MIEAQTLNTVVADCVGSLGAGILIGVLYHILRFITGNSKIATPIRDILFAPSAALLCYSYAITYSFAGILRWYILLFIGLGLLFYRQVILKPLYIKEKILKRQIVLPARIAKGKALYIVDIVKKWLNYVKDKTKIAQKKYKKQLPKRHRVLYNSNISNIFSDEVQKSFGKKELHSKTKKGEPVIKACRMFFCGVYNFFADTDPDTDKSKKIRGRGTTGRGSAHHERDKRTGANSNRRIGG